MPCQKGLSQFISFAALSDQPLGTVPFTITASSTSGLPVSFASSTSAVCTVSGATVTLLAVGTCTIQATQAGNTSYAPATPVSQSFQVTQQTQTINFGLLSNQAYGGALITLSAIASSGLAVAFNSLTPGVCTTLGSTLTLVGVGTCTIQATQAGNVNYAVATPVAQSFQVTQGNQIITFGTLVNRVFGTSPFGVSATSSSGLPVSFSSNTPSVCAVSASTVTLLSLGQCGIEAIQLGNGVFAPAGSIAQTFQVAQETLGITSLTVSSAAASNSVEVGFLPLGTIVSWSASANAPWLHLGSSASGAAILQFTLDANLDSAVRTGTITLDSGLVR